MADKLEIFAPDRVRHAEELVDLHCKTFGTYFDRTTPTRDRMLHSGFYSFADSRIGIMDGKIATHFGVYDYQMRVGCARLRTAGIGDVATHGDYRKRGLMDQTARAAVEAMRPAGYDFSVLFGIANFYDRFGYTRAWSDRDISLSLGDLPAPAKEKDLKEFPFLRDAALEKLFNRYHADTVGSAVRPTYQVQDRKKQVAFSWNNSRRQLAGYISVEDKGERLDVMEAVGESDAILAAVAFAARKYVRDEIHFICLPRGTPLARRLVRGNLNERLSHNKNAGALGRLIDLPRMMAKLTIELEHRLAAAGLGDYRGKLAMGDGEDWVTLVIDRGAVIAATGRQKTGHVLAGGPEISQLVLGTSDPGETVEAGKMRVSGDAGFLVGAMFPNRYPMLPTNDHY